MRGCRINTMKVIRLLPQCTKEYASQLDHGKPMDYFNRAWKRLPSFLSLSLSLSLRDLHSALYVVQSWCCWHWELRYLSRVLWLFALWARSHFECNREESVELLRIHVRRLNSQNGISKYRFCLKGGTCLGRPKIEWFSRIFLRWKNSIDILKLWGSFISTLNCIWYFFSSHFKNN